MQYQVQIYLTTPNPIHAVVDNRVWLHYEWLRMNLRFELIHWSIKAQTTIFLGVYHERNTQFTLAELFAPEVVTLVKC